MELPNIYYTPPKTPPTTGTYAYLMLEGTLYYAQVRGPEIVWTTEAEHADNIFGTDRRLIKLNFPTAVFVSRATHFANIDQAKTKPNYA